MTATKIRSSQIVNSAPLVGVGKSALSSLDSVLSAVDSSFDYPGRPRLDSTSPARIYFSASSFVAPYGLTIVPAAHNSSIITSLPETYIDFQGGYVSNGAYVKKQGAAFSLPTGSTVGKYRRAAFVLSSAGYIDSIFSEEFATLPELPNAATLFASLSGVPLAYADLEATASNKYKSPGATTEIIVASSVYSVRGGIASLVEADIPSLSISKTAGLQTALDGKVAANTAITGATKAKITYDAKGLVTSGEDLASSDIPSLDAAKITSGILDIARIPRPVAFDYTVGVGGQVTFSPPFDILTTSVITVKVNGIVMTEGVGFDYSRNPTANTILFEFLVPQDAQVRIEIA